MVLRAATLSPWVSGIVLFFPILLLCVPRGAGVFLGAVLLCALLAGRGLWQTWQAYRAEMRPLGLAILAVLAVLLFSKVHFGLPWDLMDNPSRLLLALLAFLVVAYARPDPAGLWRGITIALAGSLVVVLFQRFGLDLERPAAWTQPIAFANMVAAFGLIGFVRPGVSREDHIEAWLCIVLASVVLILNGTRGAWLAMSIPVFPLLFVRYPALRPAKFMAASMAIAVLAVALYAVPGGPVAGRLNRAGEEIQQFESGNVNSSVGARLALWGIAIDTFRAHPLLGIGVGQFAAVAKTSRYCEEAEEKPSVCIIEHAHSDVFEAASTTGLPGLLALLGIFLVPGWLFGRLYTACRRAGSLAGERLAAAGLAVVVASLISGLTQVTMAHQANVVFYAGIVGLLLGLAAVQARLPRAGGAEPT